jgi:hypothetical protein
MLLNAEYAYWEYVRCTYNFYSMTWEEIERSNEPTTNLDYRYVTPLKSTSSGTKPDERVLDRNPKVRYANGNSYYQTSFT